MSDKHEIELEIELCETRQKLFEATAHIVQLESENNSERLQFLVRKYNAILESEELEEIKKREAEEGVAEKIRKANEEANVAMAEKRKNKPQ
ncbi:hypothetical protein [Raoultella sp. HC6]|uniref:hypothetical protein n=1 Tax=Raoultella sp. HC6 TaxID=2923366 RepID=UPI001F504573|nr:hypothetical protein [Raoultella sp. HC6]